MLYKYTCVDIRYIFLMYVWDLCSLVNGKSHKTDSHKHKSKTKQGYSDIMWLKTHTTAENLSIFKAQVT